MKIPKSLSEKGINNVNKIINNINNLKKKYGFFIVIFFYKINL